jgi:hypothetical protein
MKVRKKPIVVDAHQFLKDSPTWPAGVFENPTIPGIYCIMTPEGRMDVLDRAYIITGVKGEKWAVREDVFDETYEILPEKKEPRPDYRTELDARSV